MKRYLVYWILDSYAQRQCPHGSREFDSIEEAVEFFTNNLNAKKKWIFKTVTWLTIIKDITE